MKIKMPFLPEFETLLATGQKTATTRATRHGYDEDTFEAFGKIYVIKAVNRITLDSVRAFFYKEEGFNSPEEFIECWNKLHPRVKFSDRPQRLVYLHRFVSQLEACVFHTHQIQPDGSCRICGCVLEEVISEE